MPRRDTRLESEGAEFLVLGQLLIQGASAYKAYTNMPGYDVVAVDSKRNRVARISVKSRWNTDATGFIISKFDCDFVVVVKLNRGTKKNKARVLPPEFFVLPVGKVKKVPRSKQFNRISFGNIPHFRDYQDRWDLILSFLLKPRKRNKRKAHR